MQDVSLYDVLGISADASSEQIRLAFLSLAQQFHPDLHSGDSHEERFKQIRHAYEILSNPDRREIYDRTNDSYATTIRQTAPPTSRDKARRWTRRAADSTFAFKTNWLRDKKHNAERWFFVASVIASVGMIVWAVQYVSEMRRQNTKARNVIQNQVRHTEFISESKIPLNTLPNTRVDFQKHFIRTEPIVDENLESVSHEESTTNATTADDPNANGKAIHRRQQSTAAPPLANNHTDLWAFPTGMDENQTYYDSDHTFIQSDLNTLSSPTTFVPNPVAANVTADVAPRPEIQPEYWDRRPTAPRFPLSIGRTPVPSQAELANSGQTHFPPPPRFRQYYGASDATFSTPSYPPNYLQSSFPVGGPLSPIDSFQPMMGPSRGQYETPGYTQPVLPQAPSSLSFPAPVAPAATFPARNF